MAKMPCSHCGLPAIKPASHAVNAPLYCCEGCSIADQILTTKKDEEFSLFSSPFFLRWVMAFILGMFTTLLSVTVHADLSTPIGFEWLMAGLSTIVAILLGRELLQNARLEIINRRPALGVLITLGFSSAYLISWIHFYLDKAHFFETAAMLMVFYYAHLLLQVWFRTRIHAMSEALSEDTAWVWRKREGNSAWVRASELKAGDIIAVEAHHVLEVDARLLSEQVLVDESYATGESLPLKRKKEAHLAAGTKVLAAAELQVLSDWKSSSMQQYMQQARAQREGRAKTEELADRIASVLLLVVVGLSISVFIWQLTQNGMQEAVFRALAVLLIGCPCTFSVAIPSALWIASHRFEREGIFLLEDYRTLERLKDINYLYFDKTGTLSSSSYLEEIYLEDSRYTSSVLKSLVLQLEQEVDHPIARYVQQAFIGLPKKWNIIEKKYLKGVGISAVVEDEHGQRVEAFVGQATDSQKKASFVLSLDGKEVGAWRLSPVWDTDLSSLFLALNSQGLKGSILSGDPTPLHWSDVELQKIYHGGLSPEQKLQFLQQRKAEDPDQQQIAFVGDGVNDLLAMGKADLSISFFSGNRATHAFSDVIMSQQRLSVLPKLFGAVGLVFKTIRWNLIWAFVYNAIGLYAAVSGWISPLLSIGIMSISSTSISLSAIRLSKRLEGVLGN
jgi:Cu+-exporting ATPase